MKTKFPARRSSPLRRPNQLKQLRRHQHAQHMRTHQQWYMLEQHTQLALPLLPPINPLAQ